MLATELLPAIKIYLRRPEVAGPPGLELTGDWDLRFLAQGEYNINYLLERDSGPPLVVRVNTGSQIGRPGGAQIAYEGAALRLLAPVGVAPRLHYLDATLALLPYGLLVMDYLPGGPLRYADAAHLVAAARTLARLHQTPAVHGNFIRRRALVDDLEEARGWLAPYLESPHAPAPARARLARLLERAAEDAARHADRFPAPFALVHTDVQAHNFVVEDRPDGPHCRLVDWERPLLDDPTYDLAHFSIPTTTRWKTGQTLSAAQIERFLAAYCAARPELDAQELRVRLEIRRPFILLRAVSWCAGAWVEYTGHGRAIAHADTLARIEEYLRPDELEALFPDWLG
ncbi:MAG: aminoglycoside phosphotransferase family protein [Oscillochloridaceae bacterium]|nr:aminoglycoside phosphotransferase family protein [Chloroflexaceae bacterium]MDW8388924.1 aminoglycoside phosphotransferase family protein [Oscillochloridaceae bacterium]